MGGGVGGGENGSEGGNTGDNDSGVDSNTLWGWLSRIADSCSAFVENIKNLPSLILDGIKRIFIPDPEVLQGQIDELSSQVERSFGLSRDSLEFLKNTQEEPIEDIKGTYNFGFVGSMDLTFFDTSALKQGIEHFRPLIRGFTIAMLLFFVFKQVLTFIGQDPGMYASAQNKAETAMKNKGD